MSKERLEEILDSITFIARSYTGVEPLIEYAKEQAERVEYLKKVLGFYADKDNYEPFGDIMRGHIVVIINQDRGEKARQALESDSE